MSLALANMRHYYNVYIIYGYNFTTATSLKLVILEQKQNGSFYIIEIMLALFKIVLASWFVVIITQDSIYVIVYHIVVCNTTCQ